MHACDYIRLAVQQDTDTSREDYYVGYGVVGTRDIDTCPWELSFLSVSAYCWVLSQEGVWDVCLVTSLDFDPVCCEVEEVAVCDTDTSWVYYRETPTSEAWVEKNVFEGHILEEDPWVLVFLVRECILRGRVCCHEFNQMSITRKHFWCSECPSFYLYYYYTENINKDLNLIIIKENKRKKKSVTNQEVSATGGREPERFSDFVTATLEINNNTT